MSGDLAITKTALLSLRAAESLVFRWSPGGR